MANLLNRDNAGKQMNLFTPGFGRTPHVLAGRDALLAHIKDGLNAGPGDPRFSTILLGNRGTGKTVILNDLEDTAAEAGWTVLPVDASTPGLLSRITAQLDAAKSTNDMVATASRAPSATRTKWTAGINVRVAHVSREIVQHIEHEWSFRRQLETLGHLAAKANTAVLLSVDELHGGDRQELRRFSADMQHIAQRASLPVAFVGAGLVDMRYTILQDRKMTFFHRCEQEWVPPIETSAAHRFYADVFADADVRCDSETIAHMAALSDGLPYKMQLLGYHTWTVAGAPENAVRQDHVDAASLHAERVMEDRVYRPTWHDLGETERSIMKMLGRAGGNARRTAVASVTGIDPDSLADYVERLVEAGCVDESDPNRLSLGPMISLAVLEDVIERADSFASVEAAQSVIVAGEQRPRCGKRMKRVNGRCVLPAGHAGRCRSR